MNYKILMIVFIFLFQFCVVTGEQDCEFQLGKKASPGGGSIGFAYDKSGCEMYTILPYSNDSDNKDSEVKDIMFLSCMNYLYEKNKCKSKKNQLKIITYD